MVYIAGGERWNFQCRWIQHRCHCSMVQGARKWRIYRIDKTSNKQARDREKEGENQTHTQSKNQYANAIPVLNPNAGPNRIVHGGLNSNRSTNKNAAGAK